MSNMNLYYRQLLAQTSDDYRSKYLGETLTLQRQLESEKSLKNGYGRLHDELLEKVRLLSDQNHTLEENLRMVTRELANYKTALADAQERMNAMKANIGNYSVELNVRLFEFR